MSPGQRVASAALSGVTGEGDKFGDAPVLPAALDAEPGCRQSCARLPPATSRPRWDRAEPTHNHPCSSPGHPPCNMGPTPSPHPCLQLPTGTTTPTPRPRAPAARVPMSPAGNPGLDTKPKMIPNCSHPQKQEPGKEAGALGSAPHRAGAEGCGGLSPRHKPCKPTAAAIGGQGEGKTQFNTSLGNHKSSICPTSLRLV